MNIQENKCDEVLILTLTGDLMGGPETEKLQSRLYEAIREGDVQIVIDMTSVNWMNSAGLGMLMAGMTTLRSSEGDLRLSNLSERVKRPIQITKLDSVIRIYDQVNDAVKSFEEGGS